MGFVKPLAPSLQELLVDRTYCTRVHETRPDLGPYLTFPALRVMSYFGALEDNSGDSPALFNTMTMPAMQYLYCGGLLLSSSPEECTTFALRWHHESPDLKFVFFHSPYGGPVGAFATKKERRNFEVFRQVYDGKNTHASPLIAPSNDGFFAAHMSVEGSAEPVVQAQ